MREKLCRDSLSLLFKSVALVILACVMATDIHSRGLCRFCVAG
jgi:hypothetical protein